MKEWKEYKLKDFADIQTGPFGSQLHAADYVSAGTPSIMPTNIGSRLEIITDSIVYIKDEDIERLAKYTVKEGDIVYSQRGDVEKCAYITKEQTNWLCGTGCLRVRITSKNLHPKFCAYYFSSPDIKSWVSNNAVGTTMPNLNSTILGQMPLIIPELPEQTAIATVLSSLDEKIDLLHRQNKTLEGLAEVVFREWFVEGAREEWPIKPLGDYVTIKRGGSPRPIHDYISDSGYNWLKISDVTKVDSPFIFEIKEHIREEGLKKTVLLKKGALVLSNSATPGIPKILDVDSCIHDGWLYFPKSMFSREFLYLFFNHIRPELLQLGNGSIFTNLKTDILKEFELPIPDNDALKEFDKELKPFFDKLYSNTQQIRTLTGVRDTLLPKVMSGEVRVEY